MKIVLLLLLFSMASVLPSAAAERDAFAFFDGKAVHLRWRGVRSLDDPHYRVYRETKASTTVDTLTITDLYRHSSAVDIRRLAGTSSAAYFGLFKNQGSDLSRADYERAFSNSTSLNLFNALCASSPVFAKVLGECAVDSSIRIGSTVRYRIVLLSETSEKELAETEYLSTVSAQHVPLPTGFDGLGDDGRATLSWNRNEDYQQHGDVVSWNVYRADEILGPYVRVNAYPLMPISFGTSTQRQSFVDEFLENGHHYFYSLRSVNVVGLESESSPTIEIVPQRAVLAPRRLEARRIGSTIILRWNSAMQPDVDNHYHIVRVDLHTNSTKEDERTALGSMDTVVWYDPHIELGHRYCYYVQSVRGSEKSAMSDSVIISYDNDTAPSIPQHCEAIVNNNVVHLRWQKNPEDDILGYEIRRASDAAYSTPYLLTRRPIDGTEFNDTLASNIQYRVAYSIVAVNRSYYRSEPSNNVIVRLRDTIPPSTPIITDFEVHDSIVHLQWSRSIDPDFMEYRLYRIQKNPPSEQRVVIQNNSLIDTVRHEGAFVFYVCSVDSSRNESMRSLGRTAEISFGKKPSAPTNVHAFAKDGNIVIQWLASSSGQTVGYGVWLKMADGQYNSVKELKLNTTTFTDTFSDPDQEQNYIVRAFDAEGNLSADAQVHYSPPKQ